MFEINSTNIVQVEIDSSLLISFFLLIMYEQTLMEYFVMVGLGYEYFLG